MTFSSKTTPSPRKWNTNYPKTRCLTAFGMSVNLARIELFRKSKVLGPIQCCQGSFELLSARKPQEKHKNSLGKGAGGLQQSRRGRWTGQTASWILCNSPLKSSCINVQRFLCLSYGFLADDSSKGPWQHWIGPLKHFGLPEELHSCKVY